MQLYICFILKSIMIKSIRFNNIKNLTVIIGNRKIPPIKPSLVKKSLEKKAHSKIKKNKGVINCDDEYIQRIIRNGGL